MVSTCECVLCNRNQPQTPIYIAVAARLLLLDSCHLCEAPTHAQEYQPTMSLQPSYAHVPTAVWMMWRQVYYTLATVRYVKHPLMLNSINLHVIAPILCNGRSLFFITVAAHLILIDSCPFSLEHPKPCSSHSKNPQYQNMYLHRFKVAYAGSKHKQKPALCGAAGRLEC